MRLFKIKNRCLHIYFDREPFKDRESGGNFLFSWRFWRLAQATWDIDFGDYLYSFGFYFMKNDPLQDCNDDNQ